MKFFVCDLETIPQVKYRVERSKHIDIPPDLVPRVDDEPQPHLKLDERYVRDLREEYGVPKEKPLPYPVESVKTDIPEFLLLARVANDLCTGSASLASTGIGPALSPMTARIVQASFGWVETVLEDRQVLVKLYQWDDEYAGGRQVNERVGLDQQEEIMEMAIVGKTLAALAKGIGEGRTLVTFNGKGFDVPMLRMRAAILPGITVPKIQWDGTHGLLYPYDHHRHCDLRMLFGNGNRFARGKLIDWSAAFGIYSEEHGADIFGWVLDGKWDLLRKYGGVEMQNLCDVYERVQPVI